MNKKIAKMLTIAFWVLFIVFICDVLYEAIYDIVLGFKGIYPKGYTYGSYSSDATTLVFAIIIPILSFILLVSHLKININSIDSNKNFRLLIPVTLMLSAVVLRLTVIWALGLHTTYNSDVAESVELASGTLFPYDFEKFSSVSSWAVWPVYLRVVRKIFGSVIVPGLVLNALYTSLSVGLIYWIILTKTQNRRWAVASAEIYAIWPMNVLFAASLRPENVNIFLTLIGLALLIGAQKKYKQCQYKSFWVFIILSSASIAGSGFFKKIDPVFLVAIAIIGILYFIEHFKTIFKKEESKRKIIVASSIFVFFAAYKLFVCAGYLILDQAYVQKVNRNPTAHYIEVGLSPWSDGTAHGKTDDSKPMDIYRYYARQAEYDYEIATKRTFEKIFSEIQEEKNLNIIFFQNKLRITWANQAYFNFISSESSGDSIINRKVFAEMTYPLAQIWYAILIFFIFLGTLFSIMKNKKGSSEVCLFSALFLFGFMLLLLICETQPRYKYAVYPYMSILAGRGIEITSRLRRVKVLEKVIT